MILPSCPHPHRANRGFIHCARAKQAIEKLFTTKNFFYHEKIFTTKSTKGSNSFFYHEKLFLPRKDFYHEKIFTTKSTKGSNSFFYHEKHERLEKLLSNQAGYVKHMYLLIL